VSSVSSLRDRNVKQRICGGVAAEEGPSSKLVAQRAAQHTAVGVLVDTNGRSVAGNLVEQGGENFGLGAVIDGMPVSVQQVKVIKRLPTNVFAPLLEHLCQ
jgi:hypothetical protein